MDLEKIELNREFNTALSLMEETSDAIFITGRAGTGKSTLLAYFREKTAKQTVVLAPTGVAALNVGGETIHSFFRFKPGITPAKIKRTGGKRKRLYKILSTIIIDEISMVRADLLDCVDRFLRLNGPEQSLPFGGVQMIFIGDLYQLPPVVTEHEQEIFCNGHYQTPYFFSARSFQELPLRFIELQKVYRQKDEKFLSLLNSIRDNSIDGEGLRTLNQRVIDYDHIFESPEFYIYLTTTNRQAAEINRCHLDRIEAEEWVLNAKIDGDFDEKVYPTDRELRLKNGSQVMMLTNHSSGNWVNGSVGRVVEVRYDDHRGENIVRVLLKDGRIEEVTPFTWEVFRFTLDKETNTLETETAGLFIQYPLKLAWAVTIHKSQGKTFDKVVIDIGHGTFAHGQMYVALSRCSTFEGIMLKRPLRREHIIMDQRVIEFMENFKVPIPPAAK